MNKDAKKVVQLLEKKARFGGRLMCDRIPAKHMAEIEADCLHISGYSVFSVRSIEDMQEAYRERNRPSTNIIFLIADNIAVGTELATIVEPVLLPKALIRRLAV